MRLGGKSFFERKNKKNKKEEVRERSLDPDSINSNRRECTNHVYSVSSRTRSIDATLLHDHHCIDTGRNFQRQLVIKYRYQIHDIWTTTESILWTMVAWLRKLDTIIFLSRHSSKC